MVHSMSHSLPISHQRNSLGGRGGNQPSPWRPGNPKQNKDKTQIIKQKQKTLTWSLPSEPQKMVGHDPFLLGNDPWAVVRGDAGDKPIL